LTTFFLCFWQKQQTFKKEISVFGEMLKEYQLSCRIPIKNFSGDTSKNREQFPSSLKNTQKKIFLRIWKNGISAVGAYSHELPNRENFALPWL